MHQLQLLQILKYKHPSKIGNEYIIVQVPDPPYVNWPIVIALEWSDTLAATTNLHWS